MATTSYPNPTVDSTTYTLHARHNGTIIVSTQASAGSIVFTSVLTAGFSCQIIQMGAGVITVTAGSGATVNGLSGTVVTGGQYGGATIIAVTDGNAVVTAVS
jgi:hypothetical protein